MRRDSSEGEWGFGSRRLAFLAIVLALLTVVACVLLFMSRTRDEPGGPQPAPSPLVSLTVPPAVTGGGVPVSSAPKPVGAPPARIDARRPAVPVVRTVPVPAARSRPTRTVPRVAASPTTMPVAQPRATLVATSSTPQPASGSVETVGAPDIVRPSPQTPAAPSRQADRNPVQDVDRREARRQAREASDAIRDIRPR